MRQDSNQSARSSETISSSTIKSLAPDEPRASMASLSMAKRAALIACLTHGSLYKQRGVWIPPTDADRRIASITIAALIRDGMLTLSTGRRRGVAHLTVRGRWFARTIASALFLH
jgi:prolyl-tRNA synthetase